MQIDGWSVDVVGDVTLVRCQALHALPDLAHAFSTRRGGGGDAFDLGDAAGAAAVERRRALCEAAGSACCDVTLVRQVHGAEVVRAAAGSPLSADGVFALRADGRTAAVRCADCVPLLLADSAGRAVAAVHAGWRGIAAGVVPNAVAMLRDQGIDPTDLVAAQGPAIGPCCYEVGGEVLDAIARAMVGCPGTFVHVTRNSRRLDLREAVRAQLERAGLRSSALHRAPWCTACARELFFSHRRSAGNSARQMACIGWLRGALP